MKYLCPTCGEDHVTGQNHEDAVVTLPVDNPEYIKLQAAVKAKEDSWVTKRNKQVAAAAEVKMEADARANAKSKSDERARILAGGSRVSEDTEASNESVPDPGFEQWLTDGGADVEMEIRPEDGPGGWSEALRRRLAGENRPPVVAGVANQEKPLEKIKINAMVNGGGGLKRDNEDEQYEGGGVREVKTGHPRFELLVPEGVAYEDQLLTRFAVHMSKGAEKYAERNWEKFEDAAALDRAKAGLMRHVMQLMTDVEDGEDHAAAILFNVMAIEHVKAKLAKK